MNENEYQKTEEEWLEAVKNDGWALKFDTLPKKI